MVINIDSLHVENAAHHAEQFLDVLPTYPAAFQDRGIVICAGGIRYNTCAWVLIKMLRHLGCTLPIQVWYRGATERDEDWIELVRPMNVQCIDAWHATPAGTIPSLGGWELKPYAILHSPFREVLLLDADNVPVRDPTYLFDDPEVSADRGHILARRLSHTTRQRPLANLRSGLSRRARTGEWPGTGEQGSRKGDSHQN